MRNILLTLILAIAPSVAHADTIRADCDSIGQPPANARTPEPALANQLSHARCLAAATMDSLKLTNDDASMLAPHVGGSPLHVSVPTSQSASSVHAPPVGTLPRNVVAHSGGAIAPYQ